MKSIADIVNEFSNENDFGDEFAFAKIKDVWDKNFPIAIQNNIKLNRFKNNILIMYSDSPAWKKEIRIRAKEIMDSINSSIGKKIIHKIYI